MSSLTPQVWADLVAIEPRLLEVERLAQHYASVSKEYNARDYESVKREMRRFVGWDASDERLASESVFTITLDHLLSTLERRATHGR
tara:strand:- start:17822 stop:18082 length:261 start_codon:yes stop_codon:yes gene_type:complete